MNRARCSGVGIGQLSYRPNTRYRIRANASYAQSRRKRGTTATTRAMGDQNDPFGGLGSNGAQKTAEAKEGNLPKAGTAFSPALTKGTMTNLLADGLIANHSDVRNPHAAHAVLTAACT